jgi:chromosome segregation ATPase
MTPQDTTIQKQSERIAQLEGEIREINGCLDWGRIANGATTLSEVQRTIRVLRETQHALEQQRIKHEMEADSLRAQLDAVTRERSLAQANIGHADEKIAELQEFLRKERQPLKAELTEARARCEEGAKDKARLDWLEKKAGWHDPENRLTVFFPVPTVPHCTVREAVDAAMAPDAKEGR